MPEGTREITYVAAIAEGIRTVLAEQPNSFAAGEDIGQAEGVFGHFRGLQAEFGVDRVFDTPISESGIVGLGVGSAVTGCRPIIDIMFMDFIAECMDEIANQLAKMRYMFGGTAKLPVTVLTMAGAGASMAAQHSQSLEAWLAHLPGLKVVMPATPSDAKGLIIGAARDDNPVVVIMLKTLLRLRGAVPEVSYATPIGKASMVRQGRDLTIVCWGRMVHESIKAADKLGQLGVDCEVVDARSLQPLDTESIVRSVRKTHRAIVVHESVRLGGWGGEVAAQIQELAFDYLDAPVSRVGAPFAPVPFSPVLESAYVPKADLIESAAKSLIGIGSEASG